MKIRHRNLQPVGREQLLDSRVECCAPLRPQIRIARKTRAGLEGLNERRLLDSKAVGSAQPRCAPEVVAETSGVRDSGSRNHSRSEACVIFRSHAGGSGHAPPELVAHLSVARLIVAPDVRRRARLAVFDFVVVTKGNSSVRKQIRGLLLEPCTVETVKLAEIKCYVVDRLADVRIRRHQPVLPVIARGKIPREAPEEIMLAEMIPNFGRHEQCLPRLACIIYVVAQRKPQLIFLPGFLPEFPGKRGVAEILIRALALRRKAR